MEIDKLRYFDCLGIGAWIIKRKNRLKELKILIKTETPETIVQKQIDENRTQITQLQKRAEYDKKLASEQEVSMKKFLINKDRNSAKSCLRRKKRYEKKISQTLKNINTIEALNDGIIQQLTNVGILTIQKSTKKSINDILGSVTVDDVGDFMYDISTTLERAGEINEAMAVDLKIDDDFDLDEELDSLDQELLEIELLSIDSKIQINESSTKPLKNDVVVVDDDIIEITLHEGNESDDYDDDELTLLKTEMNTS